MRNFPRLLLTTALAGPLMGLALAGCATTAPGSGQATAALPDRPLAETLPGVSNYGLFLAGEAALQNGRSSEASIYFARAAEATADPATQTLIREKAFTAAVMAGDVAAAARLAPPADPNDGSLNQRLAKLIRTVDALADNRGKDAAAILATPGKGAAFAAGLNLLKPWAAAAAGDVKGSTVGLDGPAPALTRVSAQFSQALLLERAKRFDEAETDYKILNSSQFAALYAIPYSDFLQRRGKSKEALELLKDTLAKTPTSREMRRAVNRLESKKTPVPPLMTIRQGAAQALTSAAEMSLIEKRFVDGQVYLRLAIRLDPQQDEAWVFLGDILANADDYDGARAAYGHVQATSPDWVDARQRVIASYQSQGDLETALRMSQDLVKINPDDREALSTEADLLRAANRFPEAVVVLDKLIAQGGPQDWALYYERGAALDRSGRWPEAEKDLQKALLLRPDQPDVLNYLGYSWITHGEKTQEALLMLQKAYLAQPDSGEIADSLGWAYYSLGDFKQAVQRLERAASLEPINAEINDHLGDAYWRAGRKTEAQFQWNRVLTLKPDTDLKVAVEKKLASGLAPQSTRS
jgi:tetratricopeptide (TPR) repeat protein